MFSAHDEGVATLIPARRDLVFAALDGAVLVHMVRGECLAAAKISDRMLTVAGQSGSDVQQMNARGWAMIATHHLGELAARLTTLFDPVVATLVESSRQGARTFELRAATALGRLWADRNEKGRAHARLLPVLETLRDAEETVDVRRARACMTEWEA
jgi:hypothetical protein